MQVLFRFEQKQGGKEELAEVIKVNLQDEGSDELLYDLRCVRDRTVIRKWVKVSETAGDCC